MIVEVVDRLEDSNRRVGWYVVRHGVLEDCLGQSSCAG